MLTLEKAEPGQSSKASRSGHCSVVATRPLVASATASASAAALPASKLMTSRTPDASSYSSLSLEAPNWSNNGYTAPSSS